MRALGAAPHHPCTRESWRGFDPPVFCEVVTLEPEHEGFQAPLNGANEHVRAPHMFEQENAPSGAQDAFHLHHGRTGVRDTAEGERAHDRIEGAVGKLERLRVADPEVDLPAQIACAPPSDLEHLGAEIHGRDANIRTIAREVPPSSRGDSRRPSRRGGRPRGRLRA